MQGTCQIAFLVFTRCRNGLLLPERRPEEADFGVEVDVRFINVENLGPGLCLGELPIDRPLSLGRARMPDTQRWAGTAPTQAQLRKFPAYR